MVADHVGLATASADGGWHAILQVYDQPTPKSASRTDREAFTAQDCKKMEANGDRFDALELHQSFFLSQLTTTARRWRPAFPRRYRCPPRDVLGMWLIVLGTEQQAIDQIERQREVYSLPYLTVPAQEMREFAAPSWPVKGSGSRCQAAGQQRAAGDRARHAEEGAQGDQEEEKDRDAEADGEQAAMPQQLQPLAEAEALALQRNRGQLHRQEEARDARARADRKSTRLNSSHLVISYAV